MKQQGPLAMADSKLPAVAQPDPDGFLADEFTKNYMGGLQINGKRFNIDIPVKEYIAGLAQFLNAPSAPSTTTATGFGSKAAEKQHTLCDDLRARYDMIFVRSIDSLYLRRADTNEAKDLCYRRVEDRDLSNLIRATFKKRKWLLTGSEVDEVKKTVKMMVEDEVQYVSNKSIQVTNNLFWDAEIGELRDMQKEMENADELYASLLHYFLCFRKMFDTTHRSKHTIMWDAQQKEEWESLAPEILEVYDMTLKHLEKSGGRLRIPSIDDASTDPLSKMYFPFVMAWADDNIDTYEDIMRAFASCFLDKKPMGSYFFIGPSRNGKTTANDLLRTILGANNCAAIRLTDFGNWHAAKDLLSIYANLPDEDSKIDNKGDVSPLVFANFKTAADHGEITMDKMRDQERYRVDCDFMSFFPMNHYPQWDLAGSGAEACVKRCWPIFFTHDFSAEDVKTTNFAEETFTPKNLAPFVGTVLALAAYHTAHPLRKSATMEAHNALIENETSSTSVYRDLFLANFNGFESQDLLWRDYMLYCQDHEYKYGKRADFLKFVNTLIIVEKDANGKIKRPTLRKPDGTRISYYKLKSWTEKKSNILHRDTIVPGYSALTLYEYQGGQWQDKNTPPPNGHSILTAIENYELQGEFQGDADPNQLPLDGPKSSEQIIRDYERREYEE